MTRMKDPAVPSGVVSLAGLAARVGRAFFTTTAVFTVREIILIPGHIRGAGARATTFSNVTSTKF